MQRQPFNQLFLIMATATLVVSAISIVSLYNTGIEQHRLRLVETVKSQARLIEAIARFDNKDNADNDPGRAREATLEKVASAHSAFKGFGETGEFALAHRDGEQIVFLLSGRNMQSRTPPPIPFNGKWAEPMRRALAGKSEIGRAHV